MKWRSVIVVLVGPGPRELARFRHLIQSLTSFERTLVRASALLIVNDTAGEWEQGVCNDLGHFGGIEVLDNPYKAVNYSVPLYDRLLAGTIVALRRVAELMPSDFALKVDTDALVCAPFADRLTTLFVTNPEVGIAGSCFTDPDGRSRDKEREWWATAIRRTCGCLPSELLRFHRQHGIPLLRWAVVRRWYHRNKLVRRASQKGWRYGDNVLGGAYGISASAIAAFARNRSLLADPMLFEGTRIADDPGVSILVSAMGLRLCDFNRIGEVFGVWYRQPPMPLRDIIGQGYGIVHSVKSHDEHEEFTMRRDIARAAGLCLEGVTVNTIERSPEL